MELRPGYKQTEVGVIPEDWLCETLENMSAFITKGSTPTTYGYQWEQSGVLFLRSECVSESGLDLTQSMFISPAAHASLRRSEVCDGDILVTITGYVGRVVYLLNVGKANLNQHIARVRVVSSKVDRRYAFFFLSQASVRKYFNTITTGQAYPQISLKQVRETVIPFPPTKAEQQAIAEVLSDADALIESLEILIAKKRQIKQGAMQELLTGKKRLPGCNGKWEETTLGKLGKCHRGVSYNPDVDLSTFDTESTVRLLRSNNVQAARVVFNGVQYVNSSRVSDEQRLRTNDILICMANGSRDLVGKAGRFLATDGFEYTFGAFMGCFRPNGMTATPDFVYYLFQTAKYRDHIAILLAGSSINNLMPSSVEALLINIPSDMAEQTAIATILSDMDTELAALETKLAKARQIKQGMMQELLTGRVRLVPPAIAS